jgi:aryl-alcohol dehydrogenase-like predicted oxidoreductase
MRMRKIGDLEVSALGLGGNNFGARLDADETAGIVHAALDAGINFFDTADVYGQSRSEEFLGLALKGRRDSAVIATKFGARRPDGSGGAHPDAIRTYLDASLTRLGVETIDLYQLHMPDPSVPIEDTIGALADLMDAGKIRAFGCSNLNAAELLDAAQATPEGAPGFISVQNEYSLLWREPEGELFPVCRELGMAFIPFFPLASGLLTGKYRRDEAAEPGTRRASWPAEILDRLWTDENFDKVDRLSAYAADHGRTLLQLALSWVMAQDPVASVIAGVTSTSQLESNIASLDWQLSVDELEEVSGLALLPEQADAN